jgi:pimeloyl-ACP methyl ester carboxylesterase
MPTYRPPGLILTEHEFEVPLDHAAPDGERITVFAREVADPDGQDRPVLVFFQGGPGVEAPRPTRVPASPGWLDRALTEFRVLMLDQRGTGRSTPVDTLPGLTPQQQADRLTHFRADSIVRDAEWIRRELGVERWSILGQSFGGFCAVCYLSQAPEGVREAFITGGLPGLDVTADDVYRATYPKVARKNAEHYQRYPMDVPRAKEIGRRLAAGDVRLPNGAPLTVEAFQTFGQLLGASTGSHTLHYLLEEPFAGGDLSDDFLHRVGSQLSFSAGPLYALVHEACYGQGGATNWAAQRVRAEFPAFDAAAALDSDEPLLFTGEMIYPWMFENDPVLAPLAEAGEILAQRDSWPRLYDAERLRANEVPAAAAVYFDDMYVPVEFSVPTARTIRGLRPWVTNEYEHDGLRVSGGKVLDRLIAMVRGNA